MSHKPARCKYAVLAQLCQLIPPYLVPKLAREHGVDKKARKFSPWSHVLAMLYTHLAHAMSLNDVCDGLGHHAAKLFAIREATPPKRNTLSHANAVRDAAMAEDLFWQVLNHFRSRCPKFGGRTYSGLPRRFKRAIHAVDATTIQLVANCMDWAKHRRQKAAAKMHLQLNLQSFLPTYIILDTARHSDASYARQVCATVRAGAIVVFDKAYVDFAHLWELTDRGAFWVTCAKSNMKCRVVKRLIRKPKGDIVRDDLIRLIGVNTRGKYAQPLRRVIAWVEIKKKKVLLTFITNNEEWTPASIADLYKSRWGIEVFFKEIKQTLKLCDFLGYSKNAILWQVWMALLLYVLLRYLAFVNDWRHHFKRLFCLFRSTIWDGYRVADLMKFCGTASGGPPMQAAAFQAYLPGFKFA